MKGRVDRKIVLITGGSRGIGAAAAELLAQEGATVIIADLRVDEGKKIAGAIDGFFFKMDVSCDVQWKKVMHDIRDKFGRLDILFNNAGITGLNENLGPQDPEYASLESWHQVHKVNLDSVFLGCKYGIALMKEQGGSIINMSSRSGVVGVSGASAYASSKAAVRNHTKTVALYCAEQGYKIRCNSLHPGAILTPLWDAMLGGDVEERSKMITLISRGVPLGKMGNPMDVAQAVLYFASDESSYVTGSELTIDGGILAGTASSPKKNDSC